MASHLRIAAGLTVALVPVLAVLIAPAGAVSTCTHVEMRVDDITSTTIEHDSDGNTCPDTPGANILDPCPDADVGARIHGSNNQVERDVYLCVDGIF